MTKRSVPHEQVQSAELAIYGSFSFAMVFATAPLNAFLPAAYAELTGLSLGLIGIGFALGRLWDGLVDPAIGMYCDKIRTRWGNRKPWTAIGALSTAICLYGLLHPQENMAFIWLITGLFLVYSFASLWQIPYLAWGAELDTSYDGRARVASFRESFTLLAGVAIPIVPWIILGSSDATPAKSLQLIATLSLGLIPLFCLLALRYTRAPRTRTDQRPQVNIGSYWRIIQINKPLQRYLVIVSLIVLAYGCFDSTMILFFRDVLGLEDKFLLLIFVRQIVALLAVPLAVKLSRKYNKSDLLLLGLALLVLTFGLLAVTPRGALAIALCAYALNGVMATMLVIIPGAMIADIADYGELKRGVPEMAQHYSMLTFIQKLPHALGPAIALTLLSQTGYVPNNPIVTELDPIFRLIALGVPSMLVIIAIIILWRFPIDRRAHAIIRKRIERRNLHIQPREE